MNRHASADQDRATLIAQLINKHQEQKEAFLKVIIIMALAQIPISTFSHKWVFVCQYGIMFLIIVIIIIIIIIYRKVKVSTLKHV